MPDAPGGRGTHSATGRSSPTRTVPSGEGALELVHGFTDTWRTWTPVLPMLSSCHDVMALNLPGHLGGPPWDGSVPLSMQALIDWAEQWLDELGLARAHLVGSSLGGWLSLRL